MIHHRPALPDVIGPVVLVVVGIALIVLSAIGANAEDSVSPQLTFLNLGIGGVVLVGAGGAVHVLGLRRAVRRRRLELAGHRRVVGGGSTAT